MYSLKDKEFDSIFRDMEYKKLCPDQGETAPSAVGYPMEERQFLATLTVAEGSYGVLQTGWGSFQEPTLMCMIWAYPLHYNRSTVKKILLKIRN